MAKKLEQFEEKTLQVLSGGNVAAAYIFGSLVESYNIPSSDIDLAILFQEAPCFKEELDLGARLEREIGCKVDLLNLNRAPINLAFRAVSCGRLVYEREPVILSDYLEQLFSNYHDFRPKFEVFLKEYNQSLREHIYMLDEERIIRRIAIITDNLRELRKIQGISVEDFLSNRQTIAAAKYFLQTSIEAMVDIGNHIIARLRFGIPENNFHTFELLVENGVLDKDKLPTYRQMVRFRNLVVRLYHIVDDERVYQVLQENLDDFEDFISKIVSYQAEEHL